MAAITLMSFAVAPLAAQTTNPSVDTTIPYGSPLTGQSYLQVGSGYIGNTGTTDSTSTNNQSNAQISPVTIGSDTETTAGTTTNTTTGTNGTSARTNQSDTNDQQSNQANPRVKAPAKPGEFERFVEERIGHKLPRFGSDLLLPSNRDYAVPATATVPPDYIMNVGDEISIGLVGSVEGSVTTQIDTDGRIFLEKVGPVMLAGVRYRDLKAKIQDALGKQYRGYDVSVAIKRLRGVRVYVTGFANNPGAYSVNSLSTMVNAVLAAGGPSAGGSFRSVKLLRNGQMVSDFDLYQLIRGGDRSNDATLQNEDVLYIPPTGDQVAVTGSVNAEAIYEIKPGETLEQMLTVAGGPTELADKSRLMLYRLSNQDTIGGLEVSRASAAAMPAEGGDIVQIVSQGTLRRPTERQAVLVRIEGEVEKPGNYYVPANTTLDAVLAQAGGLTPRAFVFGTRFERLSVQQQQRDSYREAIQQMEINLTASPLSANQSVDGGERANQLAAARAVLTRLRQMEPDGRVVIDLAPEATILPRNLVLENNDRILVPPRPVTVGVFGAVYRPASFLVDGATKKDLRIKDYLDRAGGPLRAGDRGGIFVVRANGAVLSRHSGAMRARVLPGDVIFVPIRSQGSSTFARIAQISTLLFQIGISAAAFAVLAQ